MESNYINPFSNSTVPEPYTSNNNTYSYDVSSYLSKHQGNSCFYTSGQQISQTSPTFVVPGSALAVTNGYVVTSNY